MSNSFDTKTKIKVSGEAYQIFNSKRIILAGKKYNPSSFETQTRAKTKLTGVKAVIAEDFDKIQRFSLIGMGVVPLVFKDGQTSNSLGLTGEETYTIQDLESGLRSVKVTATASNGNLTQFPATVRVDTPKEWEYHQHGGVLQFVLGRLGIENNSTPSREGK